MKKNLTKNHIWRLCAIAIIIFFLHKPALAFDPADTSMYRYKETRNLVRFVLDAAELFKKKGEKAFPEFQLEGGKWFKGDRYIFIYSMDGVCVFHPATPSLQGKNLIDLRDINGKPVIQMITDLARNNKHRRGWIHYLWVEPHEIFPKWKTAFITRVKGPDGEPYALGSGIYNMRQEKPFLEDMVDSAVALIKKKGARAFDEFNDKSSPYVFQKTFVFVIQMNGKAILDPGYPSLSGRNLLNYKDAEGHFVVKEMIKKLKKSDSAWISFMQHKPGHYTPSRKLAYVRKMHYKGKEIIVGSDMYIANPVWLKF